MLALAKKKGQGPTTAGVSRLGLPEVSAFLWETANGEICLGETFLSGGLAKLQCPAGASRPKSGSMVATRFGASMVGDGARVVVVVDHKAKVESVEFRGSEANWHFLRTLSPELSGRDVYYIVINTYPDRPDDQLDLTLKVGTEQVTDHISVAWD
ncbi:hypothetical protein [Streptomyces antibioticus]|uniref:hypothetical protein n=1 Tax=Streptomyces antibioticus TaxID=1890 RepID=UPI0033DA9022